ncbi:MAG: hypothetical protein C4315_11195, partial [Chloroflexota bacterium]
SGEPAGALRWAQELAEAFGRDREQVFEALDLLAEWWRDVLLVKVGAPELITNLDREAEIRRAARDLTLDQVAEAIRQLWRARRLLDQNVHARLTLDNLVLGLPTLQ